MTVNILQGLSVPMDGPPSSIRLFERLQGTGLLIGWANAAIAYHDVLRGRLSPIVFAMALCMVSALVVFLVARISRRRSTRAKWILIVLSALGVGPWFALLHHTGPLHLHSVLSLAQGALQAGSCALLITADARAWFAGRAEDSALFER
jgi:hypothetical protein